MAKASTRAATRATYTTHAICCRQATGYGRLGRSWAVAADLSSLVLVLVHTGRAVQELRRSGW